MAHKHSVYDTDPHFVIDPNTRTVQNVSETQTILIQHDHNSERFTFELPRFIDGHDMISCDIVQIHYINISSGGRDRNTGLYEVTDIQPSPNDENIVVFSWLVSGYATAFAGTLNFLVRFTCTTDGQVDYVWNTAVLPGIPVSNGMYNSEVIVAEYTDILVRWEQGIHDAFDEVFDLINGGSFGALRSSAFVIPSDKLTAAEHANANSIALSDGALSLGTFTCAGSKGFRITSKTDNGDGTGIFYLDGYTEGFAIGDVYTIRIDNYYDRQGTIKAINGNAITVDNFVADELVTIASYRIKGIWAWRGVVRYNFDAPVNFVSNGMAWDRCWGSENIGIYYNNTSSGYSAAACDTVDLYEDYKYMDFGDEWQEIDSSFYNAIVTYADPSVSGEVKVEAISVYDENTFRVPDKPAIGNVDIGVDAVAVGNETVADGRYSAAFGYGNHANGKYSFAAGHGNRVQYGGAVFGQDNDVRGQNAFVGGRGNVVSGNVTTVFGERNKASGLRSFAGGYNSEALKDHSFAFGRSVKATATGATAFGQNTEVSGDYAFACGDRTKACAFNAVAFGALTEASGQHSMAIGESTKSLGKHSFTQGNGSQASGARASAFGQQTRASSNFQMVVGKFNIEDTESKYAFIVGNGTSDTARSNAMAVRWDGTLELGGVAITPAQITKLLALIS